MILITRPKTEAKKLYQELKMLGINSHIDPLSAIVLIQKKIKIKKNYAVLISSLRAAKIFSLNNNVSKKVPLLIIGKVSEGLLIKANFKNIIKTFQDSISLINYLKRNKKMLFGNDKLSGIDHKTGTVSNLIIQKKINLIKMKYIKPILRNHLERKL